MSIKQSPISQQQVGGYYEDLEDEVIRFKTKDAIQFGTWIDHSLIPRGARMYAWNYRPFPLADITVKDISDWTEVAMFSLQGIYYPANAVPLLCFDFHTIRESGAGDKAKFRVVLVGENGGEVDDQTIFEGYVYSSFNRYCKEVYLSEIAAGAGSADQDEKWEWGWCIRIDVDLDGAAEGITIYKETSISLIYEF